MESCEFKKHLAYIHNVLNNKEKDMFSRPFTLAILGLPLLFGGCMPTKAPRANYAKRAYLKQQEEPSSSSHFPSENRIEKALLNLEPNTRKLWAKQDYETLDSWILRLENTLSENAKNLNNQRHSYEALKEKENNLSNRMESLIEKNNSISATLQDILTINAKNTSSLALIPPFKIHLVREGDTLYSIANKYYKSASAIPDIMDWNRGWIRYPNQIQTGIPIVLYNSLSVKKGNMKVFNFISHLDEVREAEIALSSDKK